MFKNLKPSRIIIAASMLLILTAITVTATRTTQFAFIDQVKEFFGMASTATPTRTVAPLTSTTEPDSAFAPSFALPNATTQTITFAGYTGAGFQAVPTAGQLDSDDWAFTGWSDGALAFGGTQTTTTTDYTRGANNASVGTGGVYAYTGSPHSVADPALMIQPGGSDWAPGTMTLRLQNTGSTNITQLVVSYDLFNRNDQGRSNSFNFSHSNDNTTYTSVGALDYTSPAAGDALGWVLIGTAPSRSTTITGLSIAPSGFYYIRWSGADVGGSGSRDEFGLDNIAVTPTFAPAPPSISKSFTTSPINVGQQSLLSIVVTNPNAGTALTGVEYTDTLPTGLTMPDLAPTSQCGGTFSISSNTITATGITVPAGLTCTFASSVTANGAATGVLTNTTSTVTSTNGGTGNSASANITVNATPLSGTKTVCASGCDYSSITNTGGLFAAINAGGLSGDLTVEISSDITGELGTHALNAIASGDKVTMYPTGAARTITGSSANGLITLNGVDDVIIDGSLGGLDGGDRSLTITNTNTGTSSAVIWLQNGANSNRILSLNVVGNSNTTTLFGIGMGGAAIGITSAGTNIDNRFADNNVSNTKYGIYSGGLSAATKNTGNRIVSNLLNTASPNNISIGGILVNFESGVRIDHNVISGISTGTAGIDAFGISLGLTNDVVGPLVTTGNECVDASVTGNSIGTVTHTATFSATGIAIAPATSGTNLIANNFISGVKANSTTGDLTAGIFAGGGTGSTTQIYNNSVSMTGNRGGGTTFPSYALAIAGSNPTVDARNNILLNTQTTPSTGKSYSIGLAYSTYTNLTSDYNDLYFSGTNTFAGQTGTLGITGTDQNFANWKSVTGKDANSKNADPQFTSLTDLHLKRTPLSPSPVENFGVSIAANTVDYDEDTRALTPDIGADEVTTFQFDAATYSVAENVSPKTITVTRTGGSGNAGTVQYATSAAGGTTVGTCGSGGADYQEVTGTLSFAAAETSKTFDIVICNDTVFEADETVNITLSNATGSILGAQSTAVLTIPNDDAAVPTVTSISPTSGTTAGGTAVTITGTDLTGATSATVGGVACAITGVTSTTVSCNTGAHAAGVVDVQVTTPGGTGTGTGLYTYVTPNTAPDVAVDAGSKLFIARYNTASAIARANVDGSGLSATHFAIPSSAIGVTVDTVNGKLYWSTLAGGGSVGRMNLDGSGVEPNFLPGVHTIGMAVDNVNGWLYLTGGAIRRVRLDGAGFETLIPGLDIPGNTSCSGIALDVPNNKLYYAFNTNIGRANLDGTGHNPTYITTGSGAAADDVAIDRVNNKLYWAVGGAGGKIGRANVDGTGIDGSFMSVTGPRSLIVDPQAAKIFWSDGSGVGRANLDGTGANPSFLAVTGSWGIAVGDVDIEGTQATRTGTYNDPDGDAVTISVTAGPGSVTQTGTSSGTWTWTYTPPDGPVSPNVTITATDSNSAASTTSFTVNVNNVAPTIALTGNNNVVQGVSYSLNLGAITDPGTDTVTGYSINWGDGNTENFSNHPTGDTRNHTYTSTGSKTITVSLTDEDGTHANAGTKTVVVDTPVCTAGKYFNGSACVDADPGYYVPTSGQTSQTPCAAGTFQPDSGAISCNDATPGNFVSGMAQTAQTPCSPGKYQPGTAATSCIDADMGYFVEFPGQELQTQCVAGRYQPFTGQTSCLLASAGSYVPIAGSATQTACAQGFYQTIEGATSCDPAAAGTFISGTGSAVAGTPCLAGTYQPLTGQSSCMPADPGFYVPIDGSTTQTPCAPGYTSGPGATVCTALIPTVTNVSPASGTTLGGDIVTITGTDFNTASSVTLGGSVCTSLSIISDTTITCTTPIHAAGVVDVQVFAIGGTGTGVGLYTYITPTFTLNVTIGGSSPGASTVTSAPAGISCPGDCSENYDSGTVVTLTANPAPGKTFTGWTNAPGCSTALTCDVTVTAGINVIAAFETTNQVPVAYDTSASVAAGSSVLLTLTADDPDTNPNSALSFSVVTAPLHGSLSAFSTPNCTGFVPSTCTVTTTYTSTDLPFRGDDTFTFKANDGAADSNIATATVTVTEPPPTLGVYGNTSIGLSGNTTVTPNVAPALATRVSVSASSSFLGKLAVDPVNGVVTITNAHNAKIPAGAYPITVTATGVGGTTSTSFDLTVNPLACGLVSGFSNGTDVPVGTNPVAIAVGDFNGDGKQDLATANSNSDTVSISLGDGLGGFTAGTDVSVGDFPSGVAVGDINLDGKQDIVVTNRNANSVSVRLGTGSGTFASAADLTTGFSQPSGVAVGDLNGDGAPDLAVSNGGSNSMAILIGVGDGTFTNGTAATFSNVTTSVVIGNFDLDTDLDIAATIGGTGAFSGNIGVRLNNGSGVFSSGGEYSTGTEPYALAIGDFNEDGKQDLATAVYFSNSITIMTGSGLGGFTSTAFPTSTQQPRSVAVGDFNGDGHHDVIGANEVTDNVAMALGVGNGTFGTTRVFSVGDAPYAVAAGDFDGDGRQDIATANSGTNNLSVRLGTCTPPPPVPTLGTYPNVTVDLSGNNVTVTPNAAPANTTAVNVSSNTSFEGVLTADPLTGVVSVTNGYPANISPGVYPVTIAARGPGGTATATFDLTVTQTACGSTTGFAAAANVTSGSLPGSVKVGDFNGDGKQDLAIANFSSNNVSIRLGDGFGGFTAAPNVGVGANATDVAIGDFNGDGKQDMAVSQFSGNNVAIRLGDGLGGFAPAPDAAIAIGAQIAIEVGDFNNDTIEDLAVVLGGFVSITFGNGDGTFNFTNASASSAGNPSSVAIGDFNADGDQDLAITNSSGSPTVSIRLGDGTGIFGGSTEISVGNSPSSVAVGDFNADGKQDIAVANYNSGTVSVRRGDGFGDFLGSTTIAVSSRPNTVVIGDFNRDGKQDFAVTDDDTDTASYYLANSDLSEFGPGVTITSGNNPASLSVGDFNGDGQQDIAIANQSDSNVLVRLGTCIAPPTVTSINPTSGTTLGGNLVTITGTNFTGATAVTIGGVGCSSPTVLNDTITCTAPIHAAGVVDVAVTTPGGTGTGTGLYTYIAPVQPVNLSVNTNATSEAAQTVVTVTATADAAVSGAQTVTVAATGTNITTGDYSFSSTTITIPDGQISGSETFTIADDTVYEGTETATITMSNPSSGLTLGATQQQNITIADNDTAPTISISDVTLNEGNGPRPSGVTAFAFTLTRTGETELVAGGNFDTNSGTATEGVCTNPADDFLGVGGNFGIAAGGATNTTTITVNVCGDTDAELDETFTLDLSVPTNASYSDNQGLGTIVNDDGAIPETGVSVSGTDLIITDANGGTTDDALSVVLSSGNIRINDPTHTLACGSGATQVDPNTCDVPFGSVTNIQVGTLAGNDQLTVNLSGGDVIPAGGISFIGGDPTSGSGDKLVIAGGSQGLVTYNYTNASDGNVVMSNFGTVNYTGLEPITNTGTADDIIFNLPAGPTTPATLGDDGTPSNGLSLLSGSTFEDTTFANPTGSVTINRGNAADTVVVNALPDLNSGLTFGTSVNTFSTIAFNGAVTLASDKNLVGFTTGTISFPNMTSDVATSGLGTIALTTATNLTMLSGSSLTTVDGSLTVNANQQGTPTTGNFNGVNINAATVQSTGGGVVTVNGKGGTVGGGQHGVLVLSGGLIRGGNATGITTSVNGTGGAATGATNLGVVVIDGGASVTSIGGNVSVTGTAGSGTGGDHHGVRVFNSASISAGSSGTVTVSGTGGSAAAGGCFGVDVRAAGATITSSGGAVSVTGQGGACAQNVGVVITTAAIQSGTNGPVSVTGTGGTTAGTNNDGINMNGGSIAATGTGTVTVEGTATFGASSEGIDLSGGSPSITTALNSAITLIGDSINLGVGSISSGSGQATIRQKTSGVAINLGTAGNPSAGPLNLTDGELDRITAGTLNIGNANSGTITTTADITRSAATNMNLVSAGDVVISGGQISTGGGTLFLDPGVSPFAVKPTKSLTDVTASTLSFGSDLAMVLSNTTVDSGYTQLNVIGAVNVTGVSLVLSGTPTLVGNESFTIVNNDGSDPVVGTFNLMPNGFVFTNFLGSGLNAVINYSGGDGNDVVISVPSAGTLQFSSATYTQSESGASATITVTRTGGSNGAVSANYATVVGGTATAGGACGGAVDYVSTSGTVSFGDSVTTDQTFTVPICPDVVFEGNETVDLLLTGSPLGSPTSAELTITDDDSAPSYSINDVAVVETNVGTTLATFTVTKTGGTTLSSTVHFATQDATATVGNNDYVANAGDLTFAPSLTTDTQTFTVTINGDTTLEPDETFNVLLTPVSNAAISDGLGIGAILNDECTPPPSGMTSWFDGSGTAPNANDIVGPDNGTLQSGAAFGIGKVGQGFVLNGTSAYVSVPDNAANSPTGAITVDAWIKPDAVNGLRTIVSKYDSSTNQIAWEFGVRDGRLELLVQQGGLLTSPYRYSRSDLAVVPVGTYSHVAATYDVSGQAIHLFVNGTEVASTLDPGSSVLTSINDSNAPMFIGAIRDVLQISSFFSGDIDEVEIFNRVLTAGEVANLATASGGGKCQTPIVQFARGAEIEDESQTAAVLVNRTVSVSGATDVTATTVAGGTATGGAACTAGVDYKTTSQLLSFGNGDVEQTMQIEICPDLEYETPQTVKLQLTGPTGSAVLGGRSEIFLTINDTATQFTNNHDPIDIANFGSNGNPYPSTINVIGAPTVNGGMRVTLYDVEHANPDNIDILLVGPLGQKMVIMGDAGGSTPMSGPVTLTFDDAAGQVLPNNGPLTTGKYEPTTWEPLTGVFAAPAPALPYVMPGSALGGPPSFGSAFGAGNPNGQWRLFVRDDAGAAFTEAGQPGAIAGGWGLQFLVPTAAGVSVSGRVTTAEGRGIRGAIVTVSGNSLATPINVTTGVNGKYIVEGLTAGETYVVTIRSRRFVFNNPSRVVTLIDNVNDADFVANPSTNREEP